VARPVPRWRPAVATLLAAACLGPAGAAAETRLADTVVVSEAIDDDLYAAAGAVRIEGSVAGAAALAAGSAGITGDVGGDVLVAAGRVELAGGVGDDLRAAGGTVQLTGFVTDQATIAGGNVMVGPGSAIGGRAWIAGGDVDVAGQVGGDLDVAAGTVVISGRIGGNVEVTARELRVEPGAVIGGDLVVRSDNPPLIAEDAQILGDVIAGATEEPEATAGNGAGGGWAAGVPVAAAALILLWLAPGLAGRASAIVSAAPLRTLLLGLVALAVTPVVALVLFVTVLGWLLGLVVLAGYLFALLLSGLVGLLVVTLGISRRLGETPGAAGGWRNAVILVLVVAGLVLLQRVPVLGSLLVTLLVVLGFGALAALVGGSGRGVAAA
jgi:cytoskeletal protein CcmA (bactofilin family)